MQNRRLRRGPALPAALLIALASIAAACGSTTPTPTAGPTLSPSAGSTATVVPTKSAGPTANSSADLATYAQVQLQVEQMRQLTAKKPVSPTLLDEQGVRDWMTRATQDVDHQALAAQSRLLIHLGLLPAGASLEQLELDLNAGQAIGFYDPDTGGLYLLSEGGGVGLEQKLTFSHEFTHALQDQNFGLNKLAIDTPDQSDRDLAHTALPEGDATLAMTQWAYANMSLLDLLAVSLSSSSAAQTEQLNNAPAILRQDLMFPYEQGLAFVEGIYAKGGWAAVDRLYEKPPSSTSQILHPELYAAGVAPVVVTLPAVPATLGSGWKLTMQDTMGELQLRVWLEGEHPTAAQHSEAASAVSTWAGDRIGLYEGPNGAWAVVLRTSWRSAPGQADFRSAATTRLAGLTGLAIACGDADNVGVYVASGVAALEAFAPCRPPL